jgi:hypothetical protein
MKTCAVSGASDVVLGSKPSVIIVVDLVRDGGVSGKHHFGNRGHLRLFDAQGKKGLIIARR